MELTDSAAEPDVQLTMTDGPCGAETVSDDRSSFGIVVAHRASC